MGSTQSGSKKEQISKLMNSLEKERKKIKVLKNRARNLKNSNDTRKQGEAQIIEREIQALLHSVQVKEKEIQKTRESMISVNTQHMLAVAKEELEGVAETVSIPIEQMAFILGISEGRFRNNTEANTQKVLKKIQSDEFGHHGLIFKVGKRKTGDGKEPVIKVSYKSEVDDSVSSIEDDLIHKKIAEKEERLSNLHNENIALLTKDENEKTESMNARNEEIHRIKRELRALRESLDTGIINNAAGGNDDTIISDKDNMSNLENNRIESSPNKISYVLEVENFFKEEENRQKVATRMKKLIQTNSDGEFAFNYNFVIRDNLGFSPKKQRELGTKDDRVLVMNAFADGVNKFNPEDFDVKYFNVSQQVGTTKPVFKFASLEGAAEPAPSALESAPGLVDPEAAAEDTEQTPEEIANLLKSFDGAMNKTKLETYTDFINGQKVLTGIIGQAFLGEQPQVHAFLINHLDERIAQIHNGDGNPMQPFNTDAVKVMDEKIPGLSSAAWKFLQKYKNFRDIEEGRSFDFKKYSQLNPKKRIDALLVELNSLDNLRNTSGKLLAPNDKDQIIQEVETMRYDMPIGESWNLAILNLSPKGFPFHVNLFIKQEREMAQSQFNNDLTSYTTVEELTDAIDASLFCAELKTLMKDAIERYESGSKNSSTPATFRVSEVRLFDSLIPGLTDRVYELSKTPDDLFQDEINRLEGEVQDSLTNFKIAYKKKIEENMGWRATVRGLMSGLRKKEKEMDVLEGDPKLYWNQMLSRLGQIEKLRIEKEMQEKNLSKKTSNGLAYFQSRVKAANIILIKKAREQLQDTYEQFYNKNGLEKALDWYSEKRNEESIDGIACQACEKTLIALAAIITMNASVLALAGAGGYVGARAAKDYLKTNKYTSYLGSVGFAALSKSLIALGLDITDLTEGNAMAYIVRVICAGVIGSLATRQLMKVFKKTVDEKGLENLKEFDDANSPNILSPTDAFEIMQKHYGKDVLKKLYRNIFTTTVGVGAGVLVGGGYSKFGIDELFASNTADAAEGANNDVGETKNTIRIPKQPRDTIITDPNTSTAGGSDSTVVIEPITEPGDTATTPRVPATKLDSIDSKIDTSGSNPTIMKDALGKEVEVVPEKITGARITENADGSNVITVTIDGVEVTNENYDLDADSLGIADNIKIEPEATKETGSGATREEETPTPEQSSKVTREAEEISLETEYTIKKGEGASWAIKDLLGKGGAPDWFKNPDKVDFNKWETSTKIPGHYPDKDIQQTLYWTEKIKLSMYENEMTNKPSTDTLEGLDSISVKPGDKFGFNSDNELYLQKTNGDTIQLTNGNGEPIDKSLDSAQYQETNLRDVSVSEARTIESKVPTPPPVNPNERLFGGEESTEEVIMQETNAAPVLVPKSVPISEVEEIVESEPAASNPDAAASAGFQNTANKFYGDGQGNVVASEFDKARTTIGTDNERGVPAEKVNRTRAGLNMFGADVINPQFAETQADTGSADYLRETREADNPGYDNIAPDGSKVGYLTTPTAEQIAAAEQANLQYAANNGLNRAVVDPGTPVNIGNLSGELGDMVTPDTGDNTNTIPMINQVIPGATQGINTFTNNASEDIQNLTDGDPTTSVESSLPNTQNQGPGFSLGLGGVAESLSQTGRNILESLTSGLIPGSGPAPEVDPDAFAQDNPTDTIV